MKILTSTKFWVFLIVLLYLSCVEKIQLDISKINDFGLVIQGALTKHKNGARVEVLFKLISDEKGQSRTVRVKEAFLYNSENQQISLTEGDYGYYFADISLNAPFKIDYSTKYWLKTQYFDGNMYQSDTVRIIPSLPIDSFHYKIVKKKVFNQIGQEEEKDFIQFMVNTASQDQSGKKIFKWDFQNAYKYTDQLEGSPPGKLCYVQQKADIRNLKLYDSRDFSENILTNYVVYERMVDYLFSEGYYGTVIQQAISEDALIYFQQINELNNREENIYEPPAGKIITNIRNITTANAPAYGYFYAVEQDTARLFIKPDEVGSPKRQCPVPPSELTPCPVFSCCDCLRLTGSSLQKPHFWK